MREFVPGSLRSEKDGEPEVMLLDSPLGVVIKLMSEVPALGISRHRHKLLNLIIKKIRFPRSCITTKTVISVLSIPASIYLFLSFLASQPLVANKLKLFVSLDVSDGHRAAVPGGVVPAASVVVPNPQVAHVAQAPANVMEKDTL